MAHLRTISPSETSIDFIDDFLVVGIGLTVMRVDLPVVVGNDLLVVCVCLPVVVGDDDLPSVFVGDHRMQYRTNAVFGHGDGGVWVAERC